MQDNSEVYEGEIWGNDENALALSQGMPMAVSQNVGMVQTRTPYITAMQVQQPRVMARVEHKILQAAALLGEDAFYGWGAGKGRVEGGSIHLAMVMINAYGNAVVVPELIQETAEAWYFTHTFVDLETGVSTPRQWREGKRSVVEGKMDEERKNAVRFNRGQSKNIRNAILKAMPEWLENKAIAEAKKGVRLKIEKYIKDNSLAAVQTYVVDQLKRVGVSEEMVLAKMGREKITGLDIDDIVSLSGDLKSIESGSEGAPSLFGSSKPESQKLDLKDKIKATIESTATKKDNTDTRILDSLKVSLGTEPFTWIVNDGVKEHLVGAEGDNYRCNCSKVFHDSCLHVLAVQRFVSTT